MKEITGKASAAAGKYLTFAISKERYGLEILKVQEIIKVSQITAVPRCPAFMKGVINLRGKIIPVIDLRLKFGLPARAYDDQTCVIVINIANGEQRISMGVIVDTVLEVIDLTEAEIEPAPDYGSSLDSRFVIGMGKKEHGLNILIDIEKAVSNREVAQITAEAR